MACEKIAGYHDLYWQPHDAAYSESLGMTGPEGIELNKEVFIEPITGDALGPNTVIDGIYQGANVTVSFVLQDVKRTIVKRFLSPMTEDAENPKVTGRPEFLGVVGRMVCDFAGYLYAIPRAGTPAASLNASGGSGRRLLGVCVGPRAEFLDTRPRFIPVQFQVYPEYLADEWKFWTWTNDPNVNP